METAPQKFLKNVVELFSNGVNGVMTLGQRLGDNVFKTGEDFVTGGFDFVEGGVKGTLDTVGEVPRDVSNDVQDVMTKAKNMVPEPPRF